MRNYAKIPLIFFFIAATIGLFLRWQFIVPTPGIRYAWFLHGHSHIMFLGWVFNALYLAFLVYLPTQHHKTGLRWFMVLQLLVTGMLVAFPLQGYALWSILFSTLHTIIAATLIVIFLRRTRKIRTTPMAFVRPALIFFLISTGGLFGLGYIMGQGLGNTVWNNFAIYYYLHFQYNGFFTFGVFALFFQLLDDVQISYNEDAARRVARWLAIACIPAYSLSLLFASPGTVFNLIGGAAAALQLGAVVVFTRSIRDKVHLMRARLQTSVNAVFALVWLCWVFKSLLQLASAHPDIALMAYQLRPVVIAYLHLALVGTISLFILAWYVARGWAKTPLATHGMGWFLAGFILSELVLVMLPWWSRLTGGFVSHSVLTFTLSIPMWAGVGVFLASIRRRENTVRMRPDENQINA